ncbi:hypothetical protein RAA17_00360 [Komagataeibacter rhaeticus]|nr:hypothetical protein [Komagataeibacter rhaeticus]
MRAARLAVAVSQVLDHVQQQRQHRSPIPDRMPVTTTATAMTGHGVWDTEAEGEEAGADMTL